MGIEYRLALEHAGDGALLDDDLLLVGIEVDRGELGDQYPVTDLERRIHQVTQPKIFRL